MKAIIRKREYIKNELYREKQRSLGGSIRQ